VRGVALLLDFLEKAYLHSTHSAPIVYFETTASMQVNIFIAQRARLSPH
jgi:hypothetical protein